MASGTLLFVRRQVFAVNTKLSMNCPCVISLMAFLYQQNGQGLSFMFVFASYYVSV